MIKEFRMKYLETVHKRYHAATKATKGKILDELTKVCGYHRKYAIWKLNHLARVSGSKGRPRRQRPRTYGQEVERILASIWEVAGYPWSARLKEILRLWLPWAKQHFTITPELEKKLLAISPSTIDRLLRLRKRRLKRRLYGRTKPGSLLKHQIPIRTDHWDVRRPGFVEVDLVSHSGDSATGEFLYSLNLTDICSAWTETRAVMGRGEAGVLEAFQEMQADLPFPILGLDSDNGGEFINHHLWRYCQKEKIQFTRSRPYKKDDNAHIEQKNWTHVRKLIGWDRYDSKRAMEAMNDLYRNELRLLMNLFQPSVRLIKTKRVGSRLKRLYDKPLTPLDRLLASDITPPSTMLELKTLRDHTDPFVLSQTVNRKLETIWNLAHLHYQIPHEQKKQPIDAKRNSRKKERALKTTANNFRTKPNARNREKTTTHYG